MPTTIEQQLSLLRDVLPLRELHDAATHRSTGSPDSGKDSVTSGGAVTSGGTHPHNTHIHLPPNFSAFTTVEQAVTLAAEQGLHALGVSNYYDYQAYAPFIELSRQHRIYPLFGLEIICMIDTLRSTGVKINDPGNPGKMYICGKGITRFAPQQMTPAGRDLLTTIRRNDSQRMAAMTDRLAQHFAHHNLDTRLDESAVIDMIVRRHACPRDTVYLQERHIAQAFQEWIFQHVSQSDRVSKLTTLFGTAPKIKDANDHVGLQNEIRSHLMKTGKPAFVDESFITFEQAIQLILEMSGIPSYPVLADGANPICPFEATPQQLIRELQSRNLHAAELIPIRNTPQVLSNYVKALRSAGFVVTAGTEHNTLDLLALAPTCVKDVPIPDDLRTIFWEGACVVAAHQHLTLHGQVGFVDSQGQPNPNYKSADDRIHAFAAMGARLISQYRQSASAANLVTSTP